MGQVKSWRKSLSHRINPLELHSSLPRVDFLREDDLTLSPRVSHGCSFTSNVLFLIVEMDSGDLHLCRDRLVLLRLRCSNVHL